MSERYWREYQKKEMRKRCAELGITIPENANIRQLRAAINAYNKDAVVVHVGDGVAFRQTDKPTAEYTIHFNLYIAHMIRAESEEAALKWMKENAHDYYNPDIGEVVDMADYQFIDVYGEDEEE